jgi:hypothetical protein
LLEYEIKAIRVGKDGFVAIFDIGGHLMVQSSPNEFCMARDERLVLDGVE